MKNYRIFIASSSELTEERIAASAAISEFDELHPEHHAQFKSIKWELFAGTYNDARKQTEYNEAIKSADLFLMLYWKKVGKFTLEEFELAIQTIEGQKKPMILLLRKEADAAVDSSVEEFEKRVPHGNGLYSARFKDKTQLRSVILEELQKLFKDGYLDGGKAAQLLSPNGPENPSVFLGRENELKAIREKLNKGGKLMLINAEGGIGKTTLAAKYWNESLYQYKYQAWLFCGNGLMSAIKELAPGLQIDLAQYKTEQEQLVALKEALKQKQDDFLLVLDNSNDEEEIKFFKQTFEGFHWHVLLTSRCSGILDKSQELPISHLPPPLAKALFERNYKEDGVEFDSLLDRLLGALQYHTLLIELFSKNMRELSERGETLADFVQLLEKNGLFLGKRSFSVITDYVNNTKIEATTSDEILDRFYNFAQLSEDERYWLVNMSLLPAENYSFLFLCDLFGQDKFEFKTLHQLARKGWLIKSEIGFRISPIVQELTVKKNHKSIEEDSTMLLVNLNGKLKNDGYKFSEQELSGLGIFAGFFGEISKRMAEVPSQELAIYYHNCSLFYKLTFNLSTEEQVLKTSEKYLLSLVLLDQNDLIYQSFLAVCYANLSTLNRTLGNQINSLFYIQSATSIFESLVESDDRNTNWLQNLANSYSKLGNTFLEFAEIPKSSEFMQKAVEINLHLTSIDSSNILWQQDLSTNLSRLGSLFLSNNELTDAKKFFEAACEIDHKLNILEPQNPQRYLNLAKGLNNLGTVCLHLDDVAGSIKCYSEALEIFNSRNQQYLSNLGWQHGIATCFKNFGEAILRSSSHEQAQMYFEAAVTILEDLLNSETKNRVWQLDLLQVSQRLGYLFKDAGNFTKAEDLFRKSFSINRSLLEEDIQNKRLLDYGISSLVSIGDVCFLNNKWQEAYESYSQGLKFLLDKISLSPKKNDLFTYIETEFKIGLVFRATNQISESLERMLTAKQLYDSIETQDLDENNFRHLESQLNENIKILSNI